jgi:hypothetical protein
MLQASEQSNEDSKLLQLSLATAKEQLLESNKNIVQAISDIKEEKATSTERLFNIAASLQVQSHGLWQYSEFTEYWWGRERNWQTMHRLRKKMKVYPENILDESAFL